MGQGPTLLLLHGFAMQPRTYLPLARILADQARVVIPAIFALPERWTFDHALDCIEATVDHLGLGRLSILGHSFGGGLELGLAARRPEQVIECVFADTLGVRERFGLAEERLSSSVLAMATVPAATAFLESLLTHPRQLGMAALWGFVSDREPDIKRVVEAQIPCHVLWANHDTRSWRAPTDEIRPTICMPPSPLHRAGESIMTGCSMTLSSSPNTCDDGLKRYQQDPSCRGMKVPAGSPPRSSNPSRYGPARWPPSTTNWAPVQ